jgi:hypothetical protein
MQKNELKLVVVDVVVPHIYSLMKNLLDQYELDKRAIQNSQLPFTSLQTISRNV